MENVKTKRSNLVMPTHYQELTREEMEYVDGGAWSWKALAQTVVGGIVGGAIAGCCGGSMTLPLVGTVAGGVGGAILGAVGGLASYLVCGWW